LKLKLDVYRAICETKEFQVNGINATYRDFGDKYDTSPDEIKPHVCGNMEFRPKLATQQVLDKYHISINEYFKICKKLQDCMSFGTCILCA